MFENAEGLISKESNFASSISLSEVHPLVLNEDTTVNRPSDWSLLVDFEVVFPMCPHPPCDVVHRTLQVL